MSVAAKGINEMHLNSLAPLNSLSPELLEEVIANSTVERFPPGRRIFSEKEDDNRTIFLLSGQLALMAEGHGAITLKADSDEAAQPIAEQHPRQVTALASTSVTILSIDTDLLNRLIIKNQDSKSKPQDSKLDSGMQKHAHTLFNNPLFGSLPEPHQQVLMRRMVEVKARAGEIIICEGDPSEYYYIIVEGRCRVSRAIGGSTGQEIFIAELTSGSGFGEGALIENDFHDSTVKMLDDGILLRLSKGEFLTLLVKPFVKWVSYDETQALQEQGTVLLDVRSPAAYQRSHLAGSINLPLIVLRKAATILDRDRHYIVCCDIGRRSATAAFLLAEQGINVSILDGGVRKAMT
jgi:CRP-like cAMP-binding protein